MSVKVPSSATTTSSSKSGVLTGPANCKICFESIKPDSKVLNADTGLVFVGKPMHKKCCKCSECGILITNEGFAKMRPTEAKQRKLLCPTHYIKKFGEKGIIRLQARMRRFLVIRHMEEIRKRQILLKRLFPFVIKIQKIYRGYKARQRMKFVKNKIYNK